MIFAVVLEASLFAARIFQEEIRLQTMSSLLMLPRSIAYMGYSKVIGCLMGLAPALLCLAMSACLIPENRSANSMKILIEPAFWTTVMVFLFFLHLIALLSLFIKWGALPLAFFLMGPVSTCCPVWQLVFLAFGINNSFQEAWGKLTATIIVWVLTALVCFVFQMMIAARLQALGTK
jgi:hypothetical protein